MNKRYNNNICIFGLGYVGLTLSIALAEKKYKIYGIEKNKNTIKKILKCKPDLHEPNIEKRVKRILLKKKLILNHKLSKNTKANTYIITVGTPLSKNNTCNFKMIKEVTYQILKYLKNNDHIILRSTVKIGTTNNIVKKILKKSKKKFFISFCPERTIEGKALKELTSLPQIISGDSNQSILKAKNLFQNVTKKIVKVDSLEGAEMIKLVDNMQRDVKFALSNEIALMCEKSNINVNDVIRLGKIDYPRTNLFDPGPVGGPCLEKDTYILAEYFSKNFKPRIGLNARIVNKFIIENAIEVLKKKLKSFKYKKIKICIFGLAFKGDPPVADMRGSTSIDLIKHIRNKLSHSIISGYDDLVDKKYFKKLKISKKLSLKNSFSGFDIIIIHNNRKSYSKINLNYYSRFMNKNGVIYDFWNNFNKKKLKLSNYVEYLALGNI
jgi:UDP-N-acetyl-D-mannosaminuronic acid dehydrogenase